MVLKYLKTDFCDTLYHMPHIIHLSEDFFCERVWKREKIEFWKMKSNEFSVFFTEKLLNIELVFFCFWTLRSMIKLTVQSTIKVQVSYIPPTETWNWSKKWITHISHDWYSPLDASSTCIFTQLDQGLWNEPFKPLYFQKCDLKNFFCIVLLHTVN